MKIKYSSFLIVLLVFSIPTSGFGQDNNTSDSSKFQIIKVGKTFAFKHPELLAFSIIFEYESEFKNANRFSSSYSIQYDEGPFITTFVSGGQITSHNQSKRHDWFLKYSFRYYPFLLKGKSLNLIYLQASPSYFSRTINGWNQYNGLGFDYGIGVQIFLWKRLALSFEGLRHWIFIRNDKPDWKSLDIGTTGRYYNLKIGYVFQNKKKRK